MTTTETTARANRYGVSGYPTVWFDGVIGNVGSDVCSNQIGTYTTSINHRLDATGGNVPVKITGEMSINGNLATVTAHFELVDPGYSFTAHQATLYLYEDNVTYCCGYGGVSIWNGVVRMVRSSPLTLTTVGEVKNVTQTLNITGFTVPINPANLHPAALFEEIGGSKTIIQTSNFVPLDYAMSFPRHVASVPSGNGAGYFSGNVMNIGDTADVVTLSVDAGFGWPTDFQLEGDPNYYQSHDVSLNPGESRNITVRVLTDGVKRIGTGNVSARSQNTGRVSNVGLRLFNDSYAILLVDADNNGNYEVPFVNALTNGGMLFDTVTGAGLNGMLGYDCVVWQTAYLTSTLSQSDQDNLSGYLDAGGSLFLSSMDFLTGVTMPNNFVTSYLGVASYTNNTHASSVSGVGGDPITDGMNMTLNWPSGPANRVDTVNPATGAVVIFNSDTNHPAALRYGSGSFRSVFSTVCQDALPTSGPDPNNGQSVILRTVNWLVQRGQSGVAPVASAGHSLMLQAGPNPARGYSELRFSLNHAGPARLSFLDAGGRLVRTVENNALNAGLQLATWNCTDEAGRPVPAGLYFARLQTAEGAATAKLVVMR